MKNIIMLLCVVLLAGCTTYGEGNGQVVMVSKGKAGLVQQFFGLGGDYCKIATTDGVTLSDADRAAFRDYCLTEQNALAEALQAAGIGN